MHAVAERHVAVGTARDVDSVWVVELIRVAIGRADHDVEKLALADLHAADLKILARGADAALGWRVVSEEFLSREIDQFADWP